MRTVGRLQRLCTLFAALSAAAGGTACADLLERDDAWQAPVFALERRLDKPRDPLLFTNISASPNDWAPPVARDREAELIQAAARGDRTRVQALLAEGVNPNRPSALRWGERALVHAVNRGDVEMVRILLEAGAHPNLRGNGYTPLWLAALHGHARITRLLLEAGADPDLKGSDGNTPLYHAALLGHVGVVRELLRHRPDFSLFNAGLPGYEGLNALGVAALQGNTEVVRLLLEAGADPDLLDRQQRPPLFYAVFRQHRDVILLLVEYGAQSGAMSVDAY